jgi:phosphoglycerate dehydrogenase-like enzyme
VLKGLYILNEGAFKKIYTQRNREKIEEKVHIIAPPQTPLSIREHMSLLKQVDVIFSGWGGPVFNREFLESAPSLRAVFYGGGSIKPYVTEEFWERNILITSAYAANAVPVAEFTISQVIFCLKKGWQFVKSMDKTGYTPRISEADVPGLYGTTVGIISLGMIGRRACELLKNFDLRVIAYDPFISVEHASKLNVELCSLEELFCQADVVSLHAPLLKETKGMITYEHFKLMKKNASFINTARGAIVREEEMIEALRERPDIQAVLDVTDPELPRPDSPLYTLPNVVLTPHIAGSISTECGRMGEYVVEELNRFLHMEEPLWGITREKAATMA